MTPAWYNDKELHNNPMPTYFLEAVVETCKDKDAVIEALERLICAIRDGEAHSSEGTMEWSYTWRLTETEMDRENYYKNVHEYFQVPGNLEKILQP